MSVDPSKIFVHDFVRCDSAVTIERLWIVTFHFDQEKGVHKYLFNSHLYQPDSDGLDVIVCDYTYSALKLNMSQIAVMNDKYCGLTIVPKEYYVFLDKSNKPKFLPSVKLLDMIYNTVAGI